MGVQIDPVASWYAAAKSVLDWCAALVLLVPAWEDRKGRSRD